MRRTDESNVAVGLGALAALGVTGLLVPLRETSFGNTNAALLLVVVIAMAAAVGGRLPGVTTGLVAALSFNFFLTQPYLSLRISDSTDVTTTVILVVIGFGVGELGQLYRRQRSRTLTQTLGAHQLERVARLLADGEGFDVVWPSVRQGLIDELGLVACDFTTGTRPPDMARMSRDGQVESETIRWTGEGFELPPAGVAVEVASGVRSLGWIVLSGTPGRGIDRDQRRVATGLVDLLAVALTRPGTVRRPSARPAGE